MLQKQKPYEFKKELLQIHKKDIRDVSRYPQADELELVSGLYVLLPEHDPKKVIYTAAQDFVDYLLVSMGVSAMIGYKPIAGVQTLKLSLSQDIGEANGYMGYSISTDTNGIRLAGYDDVGVAQGLYYLEDIMNLRKAPFIKHGTVRRKALFTKRTAQSPFGMYEFPDEALALMAHRGYDVISLWLKDGCTTNRNDFLDVELLSERAEKYGIRIYACLFAEHVMHPDDEGAQEYYDKLYGDFFAACPKLAGIDLLGEANQFHSRDPRAGKSPYNANSVENIPTGKLSPGFWPCCDYPQWVRMIKNAVHKHNPNADIVFYTYNWGHAPVEDRIKLIENLPEGVAVEATWDMFQKFRVGNAVENTVDYSLRFEGPGDYFISEAIAAKRCGVKLYTNAQVGGRTWDFGVIPYEPMPGQWIKRFKGIIKAHEEWGLTGVTESIHYGFHPSIIGDLEKWAFFTPSKPLEEIWEDLLVRDFEENSKQAGEATACFSEAITHYSLTNEDQYGPFRIGPSYPLWLREVGVGKRPDQRHAMFGGEIYTAIYAADSTGRNSMPGVRIFEEIKELKTMKELMSKGIRVLESCENPNDNLLRLLNLARFMHNTTVTGIHVKEHYVLNNRLKVAETKENAEELLNQIEALLLAERENVENTIPLVQLDSRLGWEPSMEYTTDEAGLRWKLRQLDYELTVTMAGYRTANHLIDDFQ